MKTGEPRAALSTVRDDPGLLMDNAEGQAIYMLDSDGRVTLWNRGAQRLTGWSEAEAVGQHIGMFYPSEVAAEGKPDADLARALCFGQVETEDWRQRKDGSRFLASIIVTALYDDRQQLRGFAKVVSDITQRRAAEEALRASESHLRSILLTAPDAMIVIDEAGVILSFSAAAERLFGYAQAEVVGGNISLLMSPQEQQRHGGFISRYLQTGGKRVIGVSRQLLAQHRDGSPIPVELTVGEAQGDHGRIFTGFMRDMTERRRAEERVAALQSELIHVSRISAMGAMASTLAHELNQPITAVVNYVEGVRSLMQVPDAQDFPQICDALDAAARESLRAGDIVRHLRDFIARGEVDKTVEPLPDLIHESAEFGLMDAREEGIDVRFDLDAAASPVLVDRVQIQQVLINLMRNAVEAMRNCAERRLTITSRLDQPGFVRVSIADTGGGVPEEIAQQLFSAFISTKSRGMGLGLSICRTIIEANGGRISMEPGRGGGAIFHFTLIHAQTEDQDA